MSRKGRFTNKGNKKDDTSSIAIEEDKVRVAIGLSGTETVSRFGSANAEFIKGYTGVDNETGQVFAKGLKAIAESKVNEDPSYAAQNIKQQAGYSAEIATTSRDNAEAIIQKSDIRTSRSDDLSQYGRNHNVVDRVQILDGEIIAGTETQMKFVGNRDQLLKDIAREDGKFSRYQGKIVELPTEQFEGDLQQGTAADYCRKQAEMHRLNAQKAEAAGKADVAAKLRKEADNFDELSDNVKDSGLTTDEAIFYREHPKIATLMDIGRTSHRAGLEGGKYGLLIGGGISLLQTCFSAAQGDVSAEEAINKVTTDTAKAGAIGYTSAFAGSALKSGMQQSSSQVLQKVATTNVPALVVSVCLSLGTSVKRYVDGEISESQFLTEVGEKGSGIIAGSMMATLGQIAIPIPVVGAAIGGMIGYTLSSMFYQHALDAALGAEQSRIDLERVRMIEAAARERIAAEQKQLDDFVRKEIPQLLQETQQLLTVIDPNQNGDVNIFSAVVNQYATLLGKHLQFENRSEFDAFMSSDSPLKL